MKQGDQFYLALHLTDSAGEELNMEIVEKIVFVIDRYRKVYEQGQETINKVWYDEENKCFLIFITEEETFDLKTVKMDARVLFKADEYGNKMVKGAKIITKRFSQSLRKDDLDNGN